MPLSCLSYPERAQDRIRRSNSLRASATSPPNPRHTRKTPARLLTPCGSCEMVRCAALVCCKLTTAATARIIEVEVTGLCPLQLLILQYHVNLIKALTKPSLIRSPHARPPCPYAGARSSPRRMWREHVRARRGIFTRLPPARYGVRPLKPNIRKAEAIAPLATLRVGSSSGP